MKWFAIKIVFLLSLALFVSYSIGEGASHPETSDSIKKISVPFVKGNSMRIVIVGDTGTGERAYAPGFRAVQKAMRQTNSDFLLHLGDFVYQAGFFPQSCPDRYIQEIKETLSDATVEIQDLAGDGNHYSATVTSSQFSGKSKIEQHKMVYNSLKGKMGNELHALAIKTKEQ